MPRTILLLSATPRDAAPLRADEEMREIQDALARSRCRDEFVIVSRTAVRPSDVRHALLSYHPAIVHFSGHGRGAQGLVLEDDHGHSLPVAGDSLAELLALAGKTRIECVLLNACHSRAQIDSIAQHVPFVIGMSEAVDDRTGIVFAAAFYQGLGNGEGIPFAYELGCNAAEMAGLAVDRVAVLAQRAMARPESAGTARRGSMHRAKLSMAAAAAFVGVSSLLGFAALQPELIIPALPHGPGGVVLAVDAGARPRELHTYQALCEHLRVQAPQEVRCVELPRFGIDHEELLRTAAQANASLLVRVLEEQELGMFPVSADHASLLASLPAVYVPGPDASQALAPVLLGLSRVMAGALDMNAGSVPPPEPDLVGWRVAALAWYLAVLAGDHAVLPPKLVHGAMQRCRQEVTLADVYCALAHYVYAQIEPAPPDARAWLEALVAHGPAWFHDSLLLELAAGDCTADAEGTTASLLRMAAAWQRAPCRRVALIGVASCVLIQGRASEAAEQLWPIAHPPDADIDECPAAVRAAAFSERATYNMLASQWHQAEKDFGNAWRLGGDPADLLNWAEAVLHQRHQRDDVHAVVGSSLDVRHFDGAYRVLAVFLRWLATQTKPDGAQLLELYATLPLHGSALIDDGETLRELACGEDPAVPECQAYRILREPKGPDSIDALRRLLVAAGQ